MKRFLPPILLAFALVSCQSEDPTSSSLPAVNELIVVHQGYGQGTRCWDYPVDVHYDAESNRLVFNFAPVIQSGVVRLTHEESFEYAYVFKDESAIDVSIPSASDSWTIVLEIEGESIPLTYSLFYQ